MVRTWGLPASLLKPLRRSSIEADWEVGSLMAFPDRFHCGWGGGMEEKLPIHPASVKDMCSGRSRPARPTLPRNVSRRCPWRRAVGGGTPDLSLEISFRPQAHRLPVALPRHRNATLMQSPQTRWLITMRRLREFASRLAERC